MWMLRPAAGPREITIDLPDELVDGLGFGAEILAQHLTILADVGVDNPREYPPPLPILCRICERHIVPWWFEKHSELCLQEHKAEMEVQLAHEALSDHRNAIVKVLDALEARRARSLSNESQSMMPPAEYKGQTIGPASTPSSGSVSGRNTPDNSSRSRDGSTSGLGHCRARSFAVRRPLSRIVELILDLCDTAIEIKTPVLVEVKTSEGDDIQTCSPSDESRVSQVLNWQTPGTNTLENEAGLIALVNDTENLARIKIDAFLRHRRIMEYSERLRIEFYVKTQECIQAAMRKAASIREGHLSDSSDTEGEEEEVNTPAPTTTNFSDSQGRSSPGISAMAAALRNTNLSEVLVESDGLRRQSVAVSTESNSPIECPTPKSHSVSTASWSRTQSVNKRSSIYGESDTGDSDGSLASSLLLSGARRTASPAQEPNETLVRTLSSRDRKRRSLKLPGPLASPRRQSPNRTPQSPFRLSKHRASLALEPTNSAIASASPCLSTKEPFSPADHHRHPSTSFPLSTGKTPLSPRLPAANPPQQKAVPPSIKDFEIIKPISKGAFGSVYLSKKKSTGDYFAIKVLKKSDMVAKNQVTNVKAERAIMMWQGESDFVAKLYWTFASKDYLYLVMEYLNGGDCASLIKVLGGLSEDWSKKYVGEVVLGVEHLHSRGIVHRDLKPDNLLIDQKGHLKLTDFGLSRMGLIGRQKRLLKSPHSSVPDLLKSGLFPHHGSTISSRSTSFDFQGCHSPANTPEMTPDLAFSMPQPSYFTLSRDPTFSRDLSRRASGYRSDSGSSDTFALALKNLSLEDQSHRGLPTGEENGGDTTHSPDPYALQPTMSNPLQSGTPPLQSSQIPPPMALFDPEDQNRRFVGTPDYLAPETINGLGQDVMSDWWSIGCILFEFLFGHPPFHADTPDQVFENILSRKIDWPSDDDALVSDEARNLISRLLTIEPKERLGSNIGDRYSTAGEEIRNHPWFDSINWTTLLEDEAQFVPNPENPEDTEYFDSRGATLQSFAEEFEEQGNSPGINPNVEYSERPHDALSGLRRQVNSMKRGLMPLHIPAHVRDSKSRRLSEPVAGDDFGAFSYKNLPVLDKANKDLIQKMRVEALKEQTDRNGVQSVPGQNSPAPSIEGSPLLPSPLKRTMSSHKTAQRSASPSILGQAGTSPNRISQPTSPLLVQFSVGPHHERRKTSSTSSASQHSGGSLQPISIFEPPRLSAHPSWASSASSPVKISRPPGLISAITSPEKGLVPQRIPSLSSPRTRSQTVGSQDGDFPYKPTINHCKRRSQVLDVSPSSSDNEDPRTKALLRVQRRRQSSRRMSQFSINDGPCFRPLDVLICEDHPVSKMVMEKLFEKLRCRTIIVANGPDAVRFATSEVQFDIIMMEFKLPQLSGTDVARMIRSTKNVNQNTPVVAVTGYLKELPQNHNFSSLIEKPPTLEKLTEVLTNLCHWKAPPTDWRPGPLQFAPSGLRQESHPPDDSPNSLTGPFSRGSGSLFHGSSREESIGSSSYYGEVDPSDTGLIIHGQSDNWSQHGLGITDDSFESKDFTHPGLPHLLHFNSAPPALSLIMPSPRKPRSSEAIKARREDLEKYRHECAESGDDEDDELGDLTKQPKSPKSRKKTSKLGTEMMRINSYDSLADATKEVKAIVGQGGTIDSPSHQPNITPPELFPKEAGDQVKDVEMDVGPPPVSAPDLHQIQEEDTPQTGPVPLDFQLSKEESFQSETVHIVAPLIGKETPQARSVLSDVTSIRKESPQPRSLLADLQSNGEETSLNEPGLSNMEETTASRSMLSGPHLEKEVTPQSGSGPSDPQVDEVDTPRASVSTQEVKIIQDVAESDQKSTVAKILGRLFY